MAVIVAASVEKKASNVFGNIEGFRGRSQMHRWDSLYFDRHEGIDFGRSSNAGI
jgi:hypothetical protein